MKSYAGYFHRGVTSNDGVCLHLTNSGWKVVGWVCSCEG